MKKYHFIGKMHDYSTKSKESKQLAANLVEYKQKLVDFGRSASWTSLFQHKNQ